MEKISFYTLCEKLNFNKTFSAKAKQRYSARAQYKLVLNLSMLTKVVSKSKFGNVVGKARILEPYCYFPCTSLFPYSFYIF